MFRCRDVGQLLYDYVEGALAADTNQQLERHLADCPGCIAFVKTYKQTARLSSGLRCEEIPPELQRKLRSFIKERLRRPSLWSRLRGRLLGSR